MMLLDGKQIAEGIKEQQTEAVKALGTVPHLAIVQVGDDPVSSSYVNVKQKYGNEIGAQVTLQRVQMAELESKIEELNQDKSVHGIIIQLPLPAGSDVDKVVNQIDLAKDVDGMGEQSKFEAATPKAILQLLSGYNIELQNKKVAMVGQGRLVGKPLKQMLDGLGIAADVYDDTTTDLATRLQNYEVIITATGQGGLIKSDMVKAGAVVVDAGTAEAGGKAVGDVDPSLYERDDVKVSPVPGGVGPLTVCALFENLLLEAGD